MLQSYMLITTTPCYIFSKNRPDSVYFYIPIFLRLTNKLTKFLNKPIIVCDHQGSWIDLCQLAVEQEVHTTSTMVVSVELKELIVVLILLSMCIGTVFIWPSLRIDGSPWDYWRDPTRFLLSTGHAPALILRTEHHQVDSILLAVGDGDLLLHKGFVRELSW